MLKFSLQPLAFSLVSSGIAFKIEIAMDEPDETPPRQKYKWPWFVLAAVVVFVALAILWVSLAAKKVEQERGGNAPVPANGR
jgi:hypothetical protein